MSTPVDTLSQPPGSLKPEGRDRPDERSRGGAVEAARPNLLSTLRGLRPGRDDAPAAASPPDGPGTAASRIRKACAACRDGGELFAFTMAFQPIVDLQESRIDAYEALVRGPANEGAAHVLGQVTPDNTYAFDQACRVKAIELAARLGIDRQLSINFLPNAVYEPKACIQTTLRAATRTGFPSERITFEILESENIADTAHLMAIISEYHRQGFKIALDDFATGYSGLSRLAELKPDIIKVDRVLARDCDKDRVRLAIIASLIALGTEIGIKVVIEGVEHESEVRALRSAGARFVQGFHFARPMFKGIARDCDIAWADPGRGSSTVTGA